MRNDDVNDVVLVFSLLTLNIFDTFSDFYVVYFEQVNLSRDVPQWHSDLFLRKGNLEISKNITRALFPNCVFKELLFAVFSFCEHWVTILKGRISLLFKLLL